MDGEYKRPWMDKFDSGEYLGKWKNHKPIHISGLYSDLLDIGEEKFEQCVGWFWKI